MSTEENSRHAPDPRRSSQGKLDVADEVVAPDYVEHDPLPPDPAGTRWFEAIRRHAAHRFPPTLQYNL